MDIPVIAIAIIAGLLLPRERALIVAAIAWAIGLVMVGWGPANNSDVHTGSAGFWVPWLVVLVICVGLVFVIGAVRERRSHAADAV
jgi:membrane protein DedA with SNARE-associated domain